MNNNDPGYWERKYQDNQLFLKWPDETVVRFVAGRMSERPGGRVLDLGCGSGRHAELLAQEGYAVCGCDVSESSLTTTRNRLQSKRLTGEFLKSFSHSLPYKPKFFDFVIACHSIFYNSHENMVRAVGEVCRVLKTGGWALITILANGDSRKACGQTQDGKTYVGVEAAGDHNGLTYCVLDTPDEIRELFADGFENVSIGYHETSFDLKSRTCYWIVTARKR